MSESIIQFAREFEKFKAELDGDPTHTGPAVRLARKWAEIRDVVDNPKYATYVDEYRSRFAEYVNSEKILSLLPDILESLLKISGQLKSANLSNSIRYALARMFFYTGDLEAGIEQITKAAGTEIRVDFEFLYQFNLDEYHQFGLLKDRSQDYHPDIHTALKKIWIEWESIHESTNFEGVNCLLVEKNKRGETLGGKIESLGGQVELFPVGYKADELSFNEQSRTPDDKFVGVVYDSFEAIRNIFKSRRSSEKSKKFIHAHFHLEGIDETYTGDSIGLAAAILTYIQILKTDSTRYDQFVSSDVAFTGIIDSDGKILPINDDTLKHKIESAFFSPVKYVVLPSGNLASAEEVIETLHQTYPRRKLVLVPAETLHDVISDPRVIKDEKICLGPYLARKVRRQGVRSIAAFSLIFLLFGWFVLAQLAPKTFNPWFDWRIDHIEVSDNKIITLNSNDEEITCIEFNDILNSHVYTGNESEYRRFYYIIDADNDGRDELLICPVYRRPKEKALVDLYDEYGNLLWSVPATEITDFDNEQNRAEYYTAELFLSYTEDSSVIILSSSQASSPYRVQFNAFDLSGNKISGPYFIRGGISRYNPFTNYDFDNDGDYEILICCTNNSGNNAGLVIVDPQDIHGICPPYSNISNIDYNKIGIGTHLRYISFPKTPISLGPSKRNWTHNIYYDQNSNTFRVQVIECLNCIINSKIIRYESEDINHVPLVIYDFDSNFIPINVDFREGSFELINDILKSEYKPAITDIWSFRDSLLENVAVYNRGKIIHCLSQGINYSAD